MDRRWPWLKGCNIHGEPTVDAGDLFVIVYVIVFQVPFFLTALSVQLLYKSLLLELVTIAGIIRRLIKDNISLFLVQFSFLWLPVRVSLARVATVYIQRFRQ